MKTKLLVLLFLAVSSLFARTHVAIGIGIGYPAYDYGYYLPPPPPPPTPVISGDEAKALAFDWLVQQGAEWGAGLVLPKDTLGIWWGTVRVNTNACSTIWGSGRWAVSCEFHVCNMFGCDQGVIHMWVYEATLTVTWAEPATTWGQP